MSDRMARPLKGDIKIDIRDGVQGRIQILVEREKILPKHRTMVKRVLEALAEEAITLAENSP